MGNIKEISLSRALSDKRLPDLPKQYRDDCGEYWLEAIVLVRKLNMSQSYAVAKRDASGKITYTADFGDISPISGLISIHPYMYLNKSVYMPFENIDQMRHALVQYIGGDDEAKAAVSDIPDSEVEYQMLQIAIEAQYSGESIKETHQAILDAVGVTPKSTITFENEGQNEETDNTNNAGGVSGISNDSKESGETETISSDDECSNIQLASSDSSDNSSIEESLPEEKPKNKGGRPKGSKNTTTRRITKK